MQRTDGGGAGRAPIDQFELNVAPHASGSVLSTNG